MAGLVFVPVISKNILIPACAINTSKNQAHTHSYIVYLVVITPVGFLCYTVLGKFYVSLVAVFYLLLANHNFAFCYT